MLCIDDEIVDKISHDAPSSKIRLTASATHRENENGKSKGLNKSRSFAKDMNLCSLASRTQESGGVNGRDDRVKGLYRNSAHHQNSEKDHKNGAKMKSVASYESIKSLVSDYLEKNDDMQNIHKNINRSAAIWVLEEKGEGHSHEVYSKDNDSVSMNSRPFDKDFKLAVGK
uniref:Uncharacterized protein n=1 Tax=Euplotes harpa TaxID=151035 RepID=A0A7S3JE61_9SPIT|mmetsp:Transcript_35459/g.41011  ORF Transcript_35459/g.41011 Transcript_35459/m.41011 type:complete len:171 (+) Transcript_35459:1295-1807(+)